MPISSLTEVYGQYDNMTSSDYVNRIGCYATYGDQVAAWLPSNQQQQRVAMATDCRASSRLQYYDDRLVYCSTDQLDYQQQQQQHWTHNKDNNCTSDRLSDKTDHRLTSYNMTSHHGGDVITMSGADSCELQQVDLSLSHLHHHHQQQQQQSRQSVYAERSSCCSPTDDHCTQQQQQQQHTQCLPSRYCSQLSYHTNSCSNSPTDCTSTGVNNLAYQSLTPGTALPVVPVGLPVPAVCRIPCDTTTSHLAPHIPVMTSPGRLPISSGNTSEATSSWLRLNDVTSNMAVDDVISDVNSNYLQYQSMTSHTPAAVAAMNIGRPSVIKELQLDTTCAADDDVTRCVIGAGMTSRRRQKPRQQRRRNVSSGAKRTSATGAGSEMENTRTGITVGDRVERVEQLSDMESIDIPPEFVNDAERRQWEREKIKKEKHNRIERRRRFNINDHIKILGSLLPNHEFTGHKFQQNKGNILKASVAYIRLLQQDQARLVTVEHRTHQLDTVNRQIITRLKELEGLLRTQGCNNNNNNISCSDYTLLPTDSCNSVNSTVVAAAVKEEPSSSSTVDHLERRRRFNINDHIKILGSLLPNHEFTGHKFQQNKGNILKASVAYIRLLQQDQARLVTVEHRTHQLDTVNRQIITRLKELEGLLRTQGCNNNNNNISCSDYTLLPTDSCNSVNSTVVAAAVKEEPSSSSTVDHRMTSPTTTTIRLTV